MRVIETLNHTEMICLFDTFRECERLSACENCVIKPYCESLDTFNNCDDAFLQYLNSEAPESQTKEEQIKSIICRYAEEYTTTVDGVEVYQPFFFELNKEIMNVLRSDTEWQMKMILEY